MIDPGELPKWARMLTMWLKELGSAAIAIMIVAFFLAQKAGFISDVEQDAHRQLLAESVRQTAVLKNNQEILNAQVSMMERNQKAQMRLARGVCMAVTKSNEIERRCLGDE